MARTDALSVYNAKRDFKKTREPKGTLGKGEGWRFVVQKHDATRLHYDFRLELDGVLKSWAVTKGPSPNPEDKRLAVRTEDHPMAYGGFEGTIPEAEYGGGTVMIWDEGTWRPVPGKDPRKTLDEGHLHFTLQGKRMKGEWLLVRMKGKPKEKRENWLLRKIDDDEAGGSGDLVDKEVTSIATGRSMAEIAKGKTVWHSDRKAAKADPQEESRAKPRVARKSAPKGKPPAFRAPQLATLVQHVPSGPGWIHEVKYDGYRCLVATGGGKARAFTRTGLDWSEKFAPIADAIAALALPPALLDGEIVALDESGKPSFGLLQDTLKDRSAPLAYFAFDLLEESGKDRTRLSNLERKKRLSELLADAEAPIHVADHVEHGEELLKALCREGYEGIISKKADAPYRSKRTTNWLKIKCTNRQEFLIIGWAESDKARGFRSLLLGTRQGGILHYAGKVGTGFTAERIDELLKLMRPLARNTAPAEVPKVAARGAHWVRPELVAEIAYSETTAPLGKGGVLRHPSFVGLREDKAPMDVKPEKPVPLDDKPFGIAISHAERVIFPESGITKGELAAYYAAMAEPILRYAAARPVSLVRCPQGRAKQCFFQKHDAGTFGERVRHVAIREKDGDKADYLYVEDGEGLITCVQMGTIEFHGWGSLVADVERPDRMILDLDPDPSVSFNDVKQAARDIKDHLAEIGLSSVPMLSGGKGLHVVVPLKPEAQWPEVKDFADRFARALAQAEPDRFTATMSKAQRKGRIFIDWLRNQRGATAILPYCVRARPGAPVAVPLEWDELDGIDAANRWTIADLEDLKARAASKTLKRWGQSRQTLPNH